MNSFDLCLRSDADKKEAPGTFNLRLRTQCRIEIITANLTCVFFIRQPWPLWTSRHLLNGVVELEEKDLPDVIMEYVIRGVMNDLKSRLINEGIGTYQDWTNISKTPKMIRRATTYGTVASLYARGIEITGIIAGIRPIVHTAVSKRKTRERAMEYWEEKMEKAIMIYVSASAGVVMVVDTEDEEPVFTMEDIPLYHVEEPL